MAKCIFLLGEIDSRLILLLIYIILHILFHFYCKYYKNYENILANSYLEGFGLSIGKIITLFVNVFIYRGKSKKIIKNQKEKNYIYLKDFSIMFLLEILSNISNLFYIFSEYEDEKKVTSRDIFINDAIEIILLSIITYYILKYKYYMHHFISIGLIAICSIIIDLLFGSYSYINIITIVNSFFYILTDIFLYSYYKYLIEFKYYFFFGCSFYIWGNEFNNKFHNNISYFTISAFK